MIDISKFGIPEGPIAADEGYRLYRGKCREMSEALVAKFPGELRLVRGHYFCPLWSVYEAHWWCVTTDGQIVDPTKLQFPSRGIGTYEEFDGTMPCDECFEIITEDKAIVSGRYAFCSDRCACRFVGLPYQERPQQGKPA